MNNENKERRKVQHRKKTKDEKNKLSEQRKRTMERKRRSRLIGFDAVTPFACFVKPSKMGVYTDLFNELKPYLASSDAKAIDIVRFDFSFENTSKTYAYQTLARFLFRAKEQQVFRKSYSFILRYFASPEHSNLNVSFQTLKARLAEWFKLSV